LLLRSDGSDAGVAVRREDVVAKFKAMHGTRILLSFLVL